jgi:hypothetical protein
MNIREFSDRILESLDHMSLDFLQHVALQQF